MRTTIKFVYTAISILVTCWLPLDTIYSLPIPEAYATITFKNKNYKKNVSLTHLFRKRIERQEGGSCHVFSAVALFEAACKNITGMDINISEALPFAEHLKKGVMKLKAVLPKTEAEKKYDFFTSPIDNDLFTPIDGGQAIDTLHRILKNSVCTQEEFKLSAYCNYMSPFDPSFLSSLFGIRDYINNLKRDYWAQVDEINQKKIPQTQKEAKIIKLRKKLIPLIQDKVCTSMDGQIRSRCKTITKTKASDYTNISVDPNLKECLKVMKEKQIVPKYYKFKVINYFLFQDLEIYLQLLDQGFPFLCSGKFYEYNNKKKSITTSHHVSTVIGYRYNEKFPQHIEFQIRDSNNYKASWGWSLTSKTVNSKTPKVATCHTVWYFETFPTKKAILKMKMEKEKKARKKKVQKSNSATKKDYGKIMQHVMY